MKKSLVLAMAMALGVTASAYAANPFSDVPAGHWAYDSISKLAAAGIIEGYGDDTFRGDRLMTRYEMAQIVAKALAKGANVDKLAAEFADELDALGVRVAALEKKSDNVKITGQFRYHYESYKQDGVKGHSNKLRSRITLTGTVNDNWKYVGLLENQQDLTDNTGNETTNFQRAYLEGRLGGVKVTAGRFNQTLVDGEVYGTRMDGIDIKYGKKIRLGAYYGKPTDSASASYATSTDGGKKWTTQDEMKYDRMWGVNAEADLGKFFTFGVGYDEFKDFEDYTGEGIKGKNLKEEFEKAKVFNAGLKFKAKDFTLGATYLHSNGGVLRTFNDFKEGSKSGMFASAQYKGAKADKVGSWGIGVRYYHMPAGLVANGWDTSTALGKYEDIDEAKTEKYAIGKPLLWEGYKGLYAKANVTVAKNMIAGIQYWDLKGRETGTKNKTLWTDLVVTF
ncbi:MAG: S-layer homology domain-containing protein [Succiniclasticum sp.]|uniref:S-layer homology domain-containing protein n=1 Tax=Succiniclasticum sp. TaxID=2775030 RepID=UPI002A912B84|nr:S-layer homology domain-containing protein [Succiniclasticum sp.]MDY6291379.1 S-layer homology domain-containing protein [Succiniclasticum sp.]